MWRLTPTPWLLAAPQALLILPQLRHAFCFVQVAHHEPPDDPSLVQLLPPGGEAHPSRITGSDPKGVPVPVCISMESKGLFEFKPLIKEFQALLRGKKAEVLGAF